MTRMMVAITRFRRARTRRVRYRVNIGCCAGARLLCSLEEAKTRVLAALTAHVRLPVDGSTVPAADLGPADLGPADPKPTDLKPTAPTGDATVEGSA